MKRYNNEVKVSIFFGLCLVGLLYLTIGTGKFHIKNEGYNLYVTFKDVAGISRNSPVMLNGMEAGRVQDMKVSYDESEAKVQLKLLIRNDIKIGSNPVISIRTLGFMGEKYVHILTKEKGEGFIKPSAVLEGKEPADMDAILAQAEILTREVTDLAKSLKEVSGQVNVTLKDSEKSINNIISNLEITSKNFEEFSEDIKKHPWKLLFKTKENKDGAQKNTKK